MSDEVGAETSTHPTSAAVAGDARGISWLALAGICAFALLLRLIVVYQLSGSVLTEVLLGDARGYFDWASEIAAGNWRGNDVFYQAPLYPYFLAVLMKAVGPSLDAIHIAQAILGSLSCALLALATSRFFSPRAGIAAGLILALYPSAIFFDVIVQKTSLALFLMTVLLALLSRFDEVESVRWPLLAGVCLGALIVTRENALVLLPCLATWMLLPLAGGSTSERATRAALFAAGTAVIVVPIGARNLSFGDQFLMTTSQLGPNLYIGNNPKADGRYRPLIPNRGDVRVERNDARMLAERAVGKRLSAGEVSDYWVAQTLDYIRDQPLAWLRLTAHKAYMVLNAEELADTESLEAYSDESVLLDLLSRVLHFGVLLPFGVFGIWLHRKRWRELFPLLLTGAMMATSVAAFFVMARYRFPLVPLLVMFAASSVDRFHPSSSEQWRAGVGFFLASALVSNLPIGLTQKPRAITWFNVGTAMLQQDRPVEATEYLERSTLLTEDPIVHITYGYALVRAGELDAAAAYFEDMLVRERAEPVGLHEGLIEIYRKLGRDKDVDRHEREVKRIRAPQTEDPAATLPDRNG